MIISLESSPHTPLAGFFLQQCDTWVIVNLSFAALSGSCGCAYF
jgi:hypothetical protein